MEKINKLIKGVNQPYRDLWVRVIISFLAAHYILSHTSKYDFFEVALVNGYTLSLIGSFLIASAIVYAIYKITSVLDVRVPYAVNWKKRAVCQLALGVLVVATLGAGLAFVYFWINDEPERIFRYFNQDFPIILAFIICFNAYYFIYYCIRLNRLLLHQLVLIVKRYRYQFAREFAATTVKPVVITEKIAFIVKLKHRSYLARYMDGTSEQWLTTIRDSMGKLPVDEYFIINQSCIIHIDIIEKIEELSSRRYQITIKAPLDIYLTKKQVTVSQTNFKAFVKWIGDRQLW